MALSSTCAACSPLCFDSAETSRSGWSSMGGLRSLRHAAGNLSRRRALLHDRCGDRTRDCIDLTDGVLDVLDAATDSPVAARTSLIWRVISSVDLAVWLASAFTSPATTAKPLPASPARAASMVAFSASRLWHCS